MIINEGMQDLFNEISKITNFQANIHWFDINKFDGYIEASELYNMLEELEYEYKRLEEKFEDLENDLKENYKPIFASKYEEYGISESDFH